MKSAFHLLLPFLFVPSPASPSAESTCGSLTKAREAIPGNAMPVRYLLHQFHKLTRNDICKKSFQLLPASTFLLREDIIITMGTFLQQGAETDEEEREHGAGSWADLVLPGMVGRLPVWV